MKDKLSKRIAEAEDEIAGEALDQHLDAHQEALKMRAMFVLGGINIADKVAKVLDSEAIKSLIMFTEQKLFEPLGFATLVDFLNESEYSPMSKAQFYERKLLLEKEGEAMFDLLTELGMSMRRRKLLGKGNVEISGDTAIVHTDGGDDIIVQLSDRTRLLETLSALADANAEKSIKIDRQKDQLDKADGKIRDAHAETDRIRASKIAEVAGNPHMIARVEFNLAAAKLADAARNLSAIEKDQFRDAVLEDHAAARELLAAAYSTGKTKSSSPVAVEGDSFGEAASKFLDDLDLETADDNDGALAAKL